MNADVFAEIETKLDRILELLEDLHKARKIHLRPTEVETELRYPLDADGHTSDGRAYWV